MFLKSRNDTSIRKIADVFSSFQEDFFMFSFMKERITTTLVQCASDSKSRWGGQTLLYLLASLVMFVVVKVEPEKQNKTKHIGGDVESLGKLLLDGD